MDENTLLVFVDQTSEFFRYAQLCLENMTHLKFREQLVRDLVCQDSIL
jgi:hypothetical protein